MQRLVLAALFVAAVVAVGAIVARGASRLLQGTSDASTETSGDTMQRVAFFLLLALMVYAILSGAS